MTIAVSKLPYSEVLALLLKGDTDFSPSLTSSLNVEQYAKKLSEFADFIILLEVDNPVGCIAYYRNEEGKFIYISHYWVSSKLQGQGYGKLLLKELVDTFRNNYKEIRLEVVKSNSALLFYQKQGFREVEDRGHKALLCLCLN